MMVSLKMNVSLIASGPVRIDKMHLITHRQNPLSRPLPLVIPLPVSVLEPETSHGFEIQPQLEWIYNGEDSLPSSSELVVTDEFGVEHQIHLKDGEILPLLPKPDIGIRPAKRLQIEKAGALRSKAGQADWILKRLEEIRAFYENDRSNTEGPLSQPLALHTLPAIIKEDRHKQLWSFRILYQSHIGALKKIAPEFHSKLIDEGFPCEDSYLIVRRKIETHSALLRAHADRVIDGARGTT
jgi:hypothetical protein